MTDEERAIVAEYNLSRMRGPYKATLLLVTGKVEKYGNSAL